jgi:hypothetical protein
MYIVKEKKITEAFQAGSAKFVIEKIINIVSKKIGKKINISTIPVTYSSSLGNFSGFFGSTDSRFFRINFKTSSSDSVYSLDLYLNDFSKPAITVILDGMNIVQVIESIAEELQLNKVNMELQESPMDKRSYVSLERKKRLFDQWLKEEPDSLEILQNRKIPDAYVQFLKKDQTYNQEINLQSFTQLAKEHLFNLGLTNPTFRPRKKGATEKEVIDKALEDKFLDLVENMSWIEKFKFMKNTIKLMHKGSINSIFVYGNPGTGKSYEIINLLDELNADYKLYKGNIIKGTDDLFRLLYNNREDKILVFDDADKVLQTTDQNIWKTVLENIKEREITYVDVKRFKNKNMSDIPPVFTFTSGIIFISNSPKLNSAIASRSVVLNVKLSNEETLAKIESTLKEFLPDVDMKIKKEALEYAKEISNGIKNVDYRSVEKIIIARQISGTDWKKYAIWLLSS